MRRFSFSGAHVVVTGAASGIGRATALELADRGARLSLVDIDRAGLDELVAAIPGAQAHVVDVSDAPAIDALAGALGPVDVLVNNAGVAVVSPFVATDPGDWDWIFGVNVRGPLQLTRALLPRMIERRAGHVVFVASLAGLVGAPGMVAYSTTKFAVVGFAEALRLELAGVGVGVTTVCPGYVRTNLHRATRYGNRAFERMLDRAPSFWGMRPERVSQALADAVEARRPMVVLGPEKLGWWLKRLSPAAAFALGRFAARLVSIIE